MHSASKTLYFLIQDRSEILAESYMYMTVYTQFKFNCKYKL